MVTGGGIRGLCVRRRRSHFHGAEVSGHSFEAVVGEKLELQEEEEAEERASRRDEGLICDEHLVIWHLQALLHRELCFLAGGDGQGRLGSARRGK